MKKPVYGTGSINIFLYRLKIHYYENKIKNFTSERLSDISV